MSSHHIIREKQEPALFIIGMQDFDPEMLGQLLEWSPTLLATVPNYDLLHSMGIKIDALISDKNFLVEQPAVKYISASGNAVSDGIHFLIREEYSAVNVVADSFDPEDYLCYTERINLVIYLPEKKIFPVRTGFSKWKEAGEQITFYQQPVNLRVSGIKQVHDQIFETEKDGFYTLEFDDAIIFVSENI